MRRRRRPRSNPLPWPPASRRRMFARSERRPSAWLNLTGPERLRDAEKAIALAQRAVALSPASKLYQLTLGAAYYRLGNFDKAIATLTAAKAGAPQSAAIPAELFLAMSYHRLGK